MSGVIPHTKIGQFTEPTAGELDELLSFATHHLNWAHSFDYFIETGKLVPSLEICGGTLGHLHEGRSISYNRKFVGLYRPSEAEARSVKRWHEYCHWHGYPTGDKIGADTAPGSKYPPHPERGDGVWVGVTWVIVRRELVKLSRSGNDHH